MNYAEPNPVDLLTRLDLMQAAIIAGNPIGDQSILGGRILLVPLATPAAPTVVVTGGASGTQTYAVVALLGTGNSPASAVGSSAGAGPTTLNATHYNTLAWTAVAGATSYNIYRVSGGASQGLIANVLASLLTLVDNGLVADGTTAPSVGTSAVLAGVTQPTATAYAADGVIHALGTAFITKSASGAALTLAAPVAGPPSAGGMDGCKLVAISTTAQAHTITTPSNAINGASHVATFGGAIGDFITLEAWAGVWYMSAFLHIVLS